MRFSNIGLVCLLTVLCSGVSRAEGPTDAERLAELVRELRHPDEKNRRLAAYGLEHFDYTKPGLGVEEAVAALSKALADGALGRIGEAAVNPLADAIRGGSSERRTGAARA